MYGAIIGDIAGSIYEYEGFTCKDPTRITFFKGHEGYTDDTVLTVAITEAILNKGEYKDYLLAWARRYPHAGYGGGFCQWFESANPQPYGSWGNGAPMRVSAVGWLFNSINEVLEQAKMTCLSTHDHPESISAAQVVAGVIFWSRQKKTKKFIKEWISHNFDYDLKQTIEEYRSWYRYDVSSKGSIPPCLAAFLESKDFVNAIQLILSIAGDADTLACIVGSMAEAFYGTDSIPRELIEYVNEEIPFDMLKVIKLFYKTVNKNNIKR